MLPRPLIAGSIVLLATGLALTAAPATAGVDDFEFESMTVQYSLSRDTDGTARLHVVETLVALFPEYDQNRGIVRDIPTDYGRVDIGVDIRSVTDETGDSVPYEESRWSDDQGAEYVSLALGTDDFVHGRTTYVIEWTAHDVIGTFDTGQEFYWDVNGTGWAQPFGGVSASLILSPDLRAAATGQTACFFGHESSTERCEIQTTDEGVEIAPIALGGYQNVTMVVGFEPGTFREGTPVDETWPFVVLPWVLLGVLAAAGLTAVAFRRLLWRHAPGRGIIVPEYEGPEELGVMAAAELLGRPRAALPAQIVKLAVDDIVQLVEDPDEPEHRRFRLDVLDRSAAVWGPDDRALQKLFIDGSRDGASLVLDRKNRKLGDRVASLVGQSRKGLRPKFLSRGERSPLRRVIFWPAFAVLAGAIGLAVLCGIEDVGSPLLSVTIPLAIVGSLVVMAFNGRPERRTEKGSAVYEQLLGLRDYLQLAEADRLRVLQSPEGAVRTRIDPTDSAAVVKLYERLLPWAIVWGVEKRWAAELAAHYSETAPPSSSLQFSSGFSSLANLGTTFAASSFATTPPVSSSSSGSGGSSSSSGFSSGGGSSGGGGGGGGGGGR
ncbi:MAG: DUF2207 domain-containing protein [Pseudolysinimonas sp.]|uniref:DUF2207 domain-containing protein n=1 Tax=Pseudolysinimonas sp. TaxID=2680009 RepID=UPI003C7634A0